MGIQIAADDIDALIDVVIGVRDNPFFVVHSPVVIHADHRIDKIRTTFGRRIAHGKIQDGVFLAVALHIEAVAVVGCNRRCIAVSHGDFLADVVVFECPSLVYNHPSHRGDNNLVERYKQRGVVGPAEKSVLFVENLDPQKSGKGKVVVCHFDLDGRDVVKVFFAVSETGFGGVGDIQVQVFHCFLNGGLGGEDHHLVVEGAGIE